MKIMKAVNRALFIALAICLVCAIALWIKSQRMLNQVNQDMKNEGMGQSVESTNGTNRISN